MTVDLAGTLVVRRTDVTDQDAIARMLAGMSDQNLYHRFQTPIGSPPRPALVRHLASPDGAAWVAERDDRIVGHAMWAWVRGAARPTAEFAVIVAESDQGRGLGERLLREATEHAAKVGAAQFLVIVSAANGAVLRTVRRHWPTATTEREGSLINFTLPAPARGRGVRGC
ncbi:GNAT family N-acetyltransferase [Kribbella sp. DT2]|uniref:GNAT family N-acetyltransferase n=1 Tax=Kribbella sp. DT2 TaxID=3393427 RepID=UPI003CF4F1C5